MMMGEYSWEFKLQPILIGALTIVSSLLLIIFIQRESILYIGGKKQAITSYEMA